MCALRMLVHPPGSDDASFLMQQRMFSISCSVVCDSLPTVICLYIAHTPVQRPFVQHYPEVSRHQKGKTNLDFTEARDSGTSSAICKSAPHSRQITTPAVALHRLS